MAWEQLYTSPELPSPAFIYRHSQMSSLLPFFFFFHIIVSQQMSFKEGNNLSALMKYSFDNMVLFSSISWGAVNLMWESFRRGAVSVFELLWATTLKKKEVYVVRRVLSFQWFLLCVVSCSNTTWVPVTCVTFGFGEFQSSTF